MILRRIIISKLFFWWLILLITSSVMQQLIVWPGGYILPPELLSFFPALVPTSSENFHREAKAQERIQLKLSQLKAQVCKGVM